MGRPRGARTSQADRWRSPQVDPEACMGVTSPRPSQEGGGDRGSEGRKRGRTPPLPPTAQPELSIALTKKLSGKIHTLKTLASSPNVSFPVTV